MRRSPGRVVGPAGARKRERTATPFLLALLGALSLAGCADGTDGAHGPGAESPTGGVNDPRWQGTDALVLISFDGFRWDYLDRYRPPAFLDVAERGVRAEGMIPPFPSKTFPSHYSIATGLHAENHGLVGNTFWDPVRDEAYGMRDRAAVEDGSWYAGEPIWMTAETQGMVAASYFFVGSEANVGGVRPSHWYTFDDAVSPEDRVDQVLAWLSLPPETRPRMITLYFSDVDGAGHRHPPGSDEVGEAVTRVDGYLRRLLDGLETVPGGERVTVLLTSDHGMAYDDPAHVHTVDVSAFDDVHFGAAGTYASLHLADTTMATHRALRDTLDAQLPDTIGVYLRSDVPPRLHYSKLERVGDVVVVPPVGWSVHPAREDGESPPSGGYTHGWDPRYPEMHGIFVGVGPRLLPGTTLPRVRHVDVYPLMAEILGLQPAPVDGDLGVWSSVLRPGARAP